MLLIPKVSILSEQIYIYICFCEVVSLALFFNILDLEYGVNDLVVAIPEEMPINQLINQSICHPFIISL